MNRTQFAIFEICRECNLGAKHKRCPNTHHERWAYVDTSRAMSDDTIIATACALYADHDFRGAIGFHYYCEPMMAAERMYRIISAIRQRCTVAQFVLWTNAYGLDESNEAALKKLSIFRKVFVTNYAGKNLDYLKRYTSECQIIYPRFDARLADLSVNIRHDPCKRMYVEIIFDFFGNVHPCCVDWRGRAGLGNIHRDDLTDIIRKWKHMREMVSRDPMPDNAPEVCLRCPCRHRDVTYLLPEFASVPTVPKTITAHARDNTPRPAVVVVAHRIPAQRVQQHFAHNDALYRNCTFFLVVEKEYDGMPSYCRQLIYPEKMDIFSLAKTKNYGIRHAIESGYSPIISSDIDIVFPATIWQKLISVPDARHAVVPIYRMIDTMETAEKYILAPNATGTVSMTAANWRAIHYHEGCVGYGCDDGILLRAIRQAGLTVARYDDLPLYHLAHIPGTPQKEFARDTPRIDHWGRAEGHNPENFGHNRQFLRSPHYDAPTWGLAGGNDIGLVAVHWRIPVDRLQAWIAWNHDQIMRIGARVLIVDDESHMDIRLPSYVRIVRYPYDMAIFSLARVANYGIRLLAQGVICKTDIDCILSHEFCDTLAQLQHDRRRILCPQYYMADDASTAARARAKPWDASKGTIATTWEVWDACCGYDERMEGYGIEDGDCYFRMQHFSGLRGERGPWKIWHVAHDTCDKLGARRLWNQKENPKKHEHNQSVRRVPWREATWGM